MLLKRPGHRLPRRRPARFGRNPQVCIPPPKPRRHNPNQSPRFPIQYKRLIHNTRICAKALYPCLVPQHEDWRRSRLVIRRHHHPPQQRRHSKKLKRSRRHEVPVEPFRPFSRPVQYVRLVIRDRPVKHMILLHIIQKLRADERRSPPRLALFRIMDEYGVEPLRIRVGKRLHHHVINHAENGRRRPNSQRQRKYGNHRKSRCLPQVPHRIPNILPHRFHVHPPVRSTPASINRYFRSSKPHPSHRRGRTLSRPGRQPGSFPPVVVAGL